MILSGNNAPFLDELYERYARDPGSVSADWAAYFKSLENGGPPDAAGNGNGHRLIQSETSAEYSKISPVLMQTPEEGVQKLKEAYRRQGHLAANLDPLGLMPRSRELLNLSLYKLSASDMDREFDSRIPNLGRTKLRNIIDWMERTYCASIGSEHFYLRNNEQRGWIQNIMEDTANADPLPVGIRLRLYEKLFQADHFEKFLARKYVGKKRFSMEGGEALIAALDTIIEQAGQMNMNGLVIGMAHRGRLNVLVNVLEKPAGVVFAEFDENYNPDEIDYADVKYHLGYSKTKTTSSGKDVHLSLAFNPSHLEAVDPVIVGSVRARQRLNGDANRERFMPIMIHGDSAFAGQGVVAETLNLMNLEGYTVGGSFHIIVNNQIGFTTLPREYCSTWYTTDLAKGFQVPIFHVNGEDPEAVFRAVRLCMEFRQKFKTDIVLDIVCFRRLGHNETDEPMFTQPEMYTRIKDHPTAAEVYEKRLLQYPDISPEDIEFIKNGSRQGLEDSFQRAKENNVHMQVDTMKGVWVGLSRDDLESVPQTRLLREQMQRVVHALTTIPEGFTPHKTLAKLIENRRKMYAGEIPIDWGFAEALAWGSILENGHDIRVSGQDAQRGTFSHRHAVITDQVTGRDWVPLQNISENQGELQIHNSSLSEYSVLGFEYGYSLAHPKSLVIWEAQFGDFANGAQIMIDQFISSSGIKWHRYSGLVMLLPHGYEGQGPEHSSARPERFLQLCADDNIQVCNCTTPAQYFHLLRRQMLRQSRRPLIIMSPKSLLRLPEAGSTLDDLGKGIFREILYDPSEADARRVERIVFCSGKIYYDVMKVKREKKLDRLEVIRVEQLYPYPKSEIAEVITAHPAAKEIVWLQEEPLNQGAWWYIDKKLAGQLRPDQTLRVVARKESASPAAGMMRVHKAEQEEIVRQATEP